MTLLQPASVELVSSPRPVPKNGAPSSDDFNEFQTEALADLADLAEFVNEVLIPILQALPSSASAGLDGASCFADSSTINALFRDNDGNLYTISQVLSTLSASQASILQQVQDSAARVQSLQQRLATTQANDFRSSIQSLQDGYASLTTTLTSALANIASQGSQLANSRRLAVAIPAATAGVFPVDVTFMPTMPSNNYVVSLAIEGTSGLTVQEFVKKADGMGLTVNISADGTNPTGTLHVSATGM